MMKVSAALLVACASPVLAVVPSKIQLQNVGAISTALNTAHPTTKPPAPSGTHPSFPWPPTIPPGPFSCRQIQYNFPKGTNADPSKANEVKALYESAFNQYTQYCFGQDDLLPKNNSCTEDLFGWGATIVDGVDTAIIMNLTDIVTKQLKFISKIDFTYSPYLVDGFDVTIRYLGGLLSSYDLLTNGYVPKGTYDQNLVDALLSQAKTLANKIKPQFDTPTGLPAYQVNFTTNQIVNSTFTSPLNNKTYYDINTAITGTIILEFHRLSDLSGDPSYRELADRAESYLVNPHPTPRYPNLYGSELDISTGNFLTYDFGWKAGIDSSFEYMIKTYFYNPFLATTWAYKNYWVGAVESTIQNIALHPYHHPELTFLSQGDDYGNLEWAMDDYACFSGGNFLLGSRILDRPDFYNLGVAVTDSCHNFYNHTATGLGPEGWSWFNSTNGAYDPAANADPALKAQADAAGYYITNPLYDSFPETTESIFYAYRITGDSRFQEYNYQILHNLEAQYKLCGVSAADVTNVNQPGVCDNYLPSFLFAEVLKYLYLSLTPPSVISLDQWVFNTEGHPLRRQAQGCGFSFPF